MTMTWLEAQTLISAVTSKIKQVKLVLDIGCGIKPQKYIRPEIQICWDPFAPYLEHLQTALAGKTSPLYIYVNAGWAEAVELLPPRSVDTIFLLDVVEHLEKTQGLQLLERTKPLVRQQVVVFTPLGFLPQHSLDGKDRWGLDGGVWQEHQSGWLPEDFGVDWDVYAAQQFHLRDDVEYGAFWAIYNR
jgi:hypothetical protein